MCALASITEFEDDDLSVDEENAVYEKSHHGACKLLDDADCYSATGDDFEDVPCFA